MSLHEQLPHAEHRCLRRTPSPFGEHVVEPGRLATRPRPSHGDCSRILLMREAPHALRAHANTGSAMRLGSALQSTAGHPLPALPWPRQGVHVCRCVCRCVCRYVCTCTCDFAELCVLKKPRMTGLEVVHRRPWQARWPHRSAEVWLWPASVSGHLQTSVLSRRTEAEGRAARSGCLERQRTGDCAAKRRRHKRMRFGVRTSWRGVAGLFA